MKKKSKSSKNIKAIKRIVSKPSRKNWELQFANALKKDKVLDKTDYIENNFDETEWTW
jgi:hypothetical protein